MYDLTLVLLIIFGYIFSSVMWIIPAMCHAKWDTQGWPAGFLLSGLWLFYALRNYLFFTNPSNQIDLWGMYLNLGGVIVLAVSSYYLAQPYFKHIKNGLKK